MNNIVNTTVGSVMPKNEPLVSRKKKSINKVKEEVYELLDIEETVDSFKQSYTGKLQEHIAIFKSLEDIEKKRLNKLLADLKFLTKEISIKHLINSNLEGLASYLARLKVTLLTKDVAVTKRILHKFVKQKDMNIDYISDEIDDFSLKLDQLETVYMKFIDMVNSISRGLENKVHLNHDGVHRIDDLRKLVLKQRELLFNISDNLKIICTDLAKIRSCKKVLKELGLVF